MTTTIVIAGIAVLFAVLEGATAGCIFWLRKSCPWLIVARDERPVIDASGLDSFIAHGWDPELGWVRKPDTSGIEKGRLDTEVRYHIDGSGARRNPGFEDSPPAILAYGDSYTFARQVNDDETWAHYLSEALGRNVANYGVGNYGFDQALLRLEREFDEHPAPVVVIGVVPETMSRIHAYWKHYSEYGNTFAFKPRFAVVDGKLQLRPNLVDNPEKFFRIDEFRQQLAEGDYFYAAKFKRDILKFPYFMSLFRNPGRTLPLIWAAFTDRVGITRNNAFVQVIRRNITMNRELYAADEAKALFSAIVHRFAAFCRARGAAPVLLMIPQRMDIERIQNGDHYYKPFLDGLAEQVHVIDAASVLANTDADDGLFINDQYGGHLSPRGNRLVADLIAPGYSTCLEEAAATADDASPADDADYTPSKITPGRPTT